MEDALKLLNEKIKSELKESIINAYRARNGILDSSSLKADIKESLALGLRAILKFDEIANTLGGVEIKSRSTSKSQCIFIAPTLILTINN